MTQIADVAEAARMTRAVLADLADSESELTASAATRHRLEGTAVALKAVSTNGPLRDTTE